MPEPAYLELHRNGKLRKRVKQALAMMKPCRLCPRECGVDRLAGEKGFCRTGRKAVAASFNQHFGEEAPLVGTFGSGTIFFSSCNLLCSFCQNHDISHGMAGFEVGPEHTAKMMLDLAARGCHNINFVTPTHVVPQILEALVLAAERGLTTPLVFNSGGYDSVDALRLLEGVFDIYMPDFKFWDNRWAERYCQTPDYREKATAAVKEMHRQVGDLATDERSIAVSGLLVRHLVMPNDVAGTLGVMKFLADEVSVNTCVNVMAQYRPCGSAAADDVVNRRISREEFRQALDAAQQAGLHRLD